MKLLRRMITRRAFIRGSTALIAGAALSVAFSPNLLESRLAHAEATELRPDLRPLAKYLKDRRIENTSNGRRLLWFSNGIGNYGGGALEVRGHKTGPNMQALQRVYKSDGSFVDYDVGQFEFDSTHNHWHFKDYVEYMVTNKDDPSKTAFSHKASFCLLDIDRISPRLPGSPNGPVYNRCNQGNSNATSIGPQGISVGWIDVYNKFVEGQFIDITGLSSGKYILSAKANPNDTLIETNTTNNTASVTITIG